MVSFMQVDWLPYGRDPATTVPRTLLTGLIRYRDIVEPYMALRVLRQLGYVQHVPPRPLRPAVEHRPWASKSYKVEFMGPLAEDMWECFPEVYAIRLTDHAATTDDLGACIPTYLNWYEPRSHPRLVGPVGGDVGGAQRRTNVDYVSDLNNFIIS